MATSFLVQENLEGIFNSDMKCLFCALGAFAYLVKVIWGLFNEPILFPPYHATWTAPITLVLYILQV